MGRQDIKEREAEGLIALSKIDPSLPGAMHDPLVDHIMDRFVSGEPINHEDNVDWHEEMKLHLVEMHELLPGMAELVLDVTEYNARARLSERGEA